MFEQPDGVSQPFLTEQGHQGLAGVPAKEAHQMLWGEAHILGQLTHADTLHRAPPGYLAGVGDGGVLHNMRHGKLRSFDDVQGQGGARRRR